MQVVPLGCDDGIIVYLGKLIESLLLLAEQLHGLLIGEHAHLLETDIGGVEGKAGDGVIGVRLVPVAIHGGVVDRK